MKNTIRNLGRVAFLGAMLLTANITVAQTAADSTTTATTTATTTTTSAGTFTQYGPDGIVIRTATSPDPVSYSYTNTTTYVDENGNPVSIETVKSGAPVTIYYDRDGNKMVATKVVVRKTTVVNPVNPISPGTQSTSTMTTSAGTVTQFNSNAIVIKSAASSDPLTYSYTKTTTYVDENGNPVSIKTVQSGVPVTVYYDRNGNKMVATKVVVRKTTTTTTPNPTQ